jgi:hypothetical protein
MYLPFCGPSAVFGVVAEIAILADFADLLYILCEPVLCSELSQGYGNGQCLSKHKPLAFLHGG